ncbi:MAG: DMT family transporter [Acidobacteria bacterium]|nr:DMT family transporter [Acidobacteriota bacterium]
MAFVVLIWGGNFAVLKTAYSQIAPFPFAALRFALATVLMMALLWWREGDVRFPKGSFWKFVWLGVIGNTIYQALFANGLAMTTSANSSLIASTSPVAVAIAGGLIGLERITRFTVLGMALALGGISIVVGSRGAALTSHTLWGDLLVLGSVACWAAYVLGMRTVKGHISSLRATTLTMMTGTPGLILFGLPGLAKMQQTGWRGIGTAAIFGIIYSAALALVACYLLYNRNVRLIGGVKTAIYGCLIPVVAALIAWPVLGERPTLLQITGAVLILAGVLLTRRK